MHKPCGLYAQLILTYEDHNQPKQDEISFVRGTPDVDKFERKINLSSVRGRKYG
jgi:hypothetical protein